MSGHVIYKYDKEDGSLPTHTKRSFNENRILTIQNLITKNALLFIHQVKYFRSRLPPSICELIPEDAPCFSETPDLDSHLEWDKTYNSVPFRNSIFFKGPLLAITRENNSILNDMGSVQSLYSYKTSVKSFLLQYQSIGDSDQWPTFLINNIRGLRSSQR